MCVLVPFYVYLYRHERRGYTEHPRTPDPYEVQSKRSFDGRIKAWRRELHKWDTLHPPPPVPVSVNPALSLIGPTGNTNTWYPDIYWKYVILK